MGKRFDYRKNNLSALSTLVDRTTRKTILVPAKSRDDVEFDDLKLKTLFSKDKVF